jgi:DNA polymerase III delta subunit
MVERTGPDIARLRAAFDRLVLYALGQPAITVDDVQESVAAGPEQQENFGIANAIQRNDAPEALTQLAAALDGGAVPVMVLGQLRVAAERMPKPRVRAAVDALFRTDLALKSSGGDPRILLERLVVELCEAPRRGAPSLR